MALLTSWPAIKLISWPVGDFRMAGSEALDVDFIDDGIVAGGGGGTVIFPIEVGVVTTDLGTPQPLS